MRIVFNGQPQDVPPGTTIAALLDQLGFERRYVAVEVNLELVPRQRHDDFELHDEDRLEVVTLVGGG